MRSLTVHILLFMFTVFTSTLVVTATVSDDWRFIFKKTIEWFGWFTLAAVVCSVGVFFIS